MEILLAIFQWTKVNGRFKVASGVSSLFVFHVAVTLTGAKVIIKHTYLVANHIEAVGLLIFFASLLLLS